MVTGRAKVLHKESKLTGSPISDLMPKSVQAARTEENYSNFRSLDDT